MPASSVSVVCPCCGQTTWYEQAAPVDAECFACLNGCDWPGQCHEDPDD